MSPGVVDHQVLETEENMIDLERDLNQGALVNEELRRDRELKPSHAGGLEAADFRAQGDPQLHSHAFWNSAGSLQNQRSTAAVDPVLLGKGLKPAASSLLNSNREGQTAATSGDLKHSKMQDSTKSRHAGTRDRHHFNFFMVTLRNLFMTVDEMVNSQNPMFGETVALFAEVVGEIVKLEPTLASAVVLGFERFFCKFADHSYLIRRQEFEKILAVFMQIFQSYLRSPRPGPGLEAEKENWDILSENKLDIIECVDEVQNIDMASTLKVVEALSVFTPALHYLLDSKVSWEHWKPISSALGPFFGVFLDNVHNAEHHFEFLVQVAHLVSLALKTRKCTVALDYAAVEVLFQLLFKKMVQKSSETLGRKSLWLCVTLNNLKKSIANSTSRVMPGIFFTSSTVSQFAPLVESLVSKIVGDTARDVEQTFKLFELLESFFEMLFELTKTAKRQMNHFKQEIFEEMREVALKAVDQLDLLKRVKGVKGKMTEQILCRIWAINDVLSQ